MLPVLFPSVGITKNIRKGQKSTVRTLCLEAGIECKVTGAAAEREVYLHVSPKLEAMREPGAYGRVSIGSPEKDVRKRAIVALGILAYSVFDYASRESLRGRPEVRCALPVGRPRKSKPLRGAERQRRWRNRKKQAKRIEEIRSAFRARLASTRPKLVAPDPPPVYDEVFHEGVRALNADMEEPLALESGKVIFNPEIR